MPSSNDQIQPPSATPDLPAGKETSFRSMGEVLKGMRTKPAAATATKATREWSLGLEGPRIGLGVVWVMGAILLGVPFLMCLVAGKTFLTQGGLGYCLGVGGLLFSCTVSAVHDMIGAVVSHKSVRTEVVKGAG